MAIAYFIPDSAKLLSGSQANNNGQTNGGNGSSPSVNSASNSSGSNVSQQSAPSSASAATTTTAPAGGTPPVMSNPANSSQHPATHQYQQHHGSNFCANITIPITATFGGNNAEVSSTSQQVPQQQNNLNTNANNGVGNNDGNNNNNGYWELLTQIFCYALRFCHESRRPAVIQISFELNTGLPSNTMASAIDTANAATAQGEAVNNATTVTIQQDQQSPSTANGIHFVAPTIEITTIRTTFDESPRLISSGSSSAHDATDGTDGSDTSDHPVDSMVDPNVAMDLQSSLDETVLVESSFDSIDLETSLNGNSSDSSDPSIQRSDVEDSQHF